MMISSQQQRIINILADGTVHSGRQIGGLLKLSRTSVWKHIKQLQKMGLPIETYPQHGYQFKDAFIPLDKEKIQQKSPYPFVVYHVMPSAKSTNSAIKDMFCDTPQVCVVEMQTAGRGRLGRTWFSPYGENIYYSLGLAFEGSLASLSGLSLIISLSVLGALKRCDAAQGLQVKWPNDVLHEGKKVAGILIEVNGESHGASQVTIGIGINVNAKNAKHDAMQDSWTSLRDINGQSFNRNEIIAQLTCLLLDDIDRFKTYGFKSFMNQWHDNDFLLNKKIQVKQHDIVIQGTVIGIAETGALLLEDDSGRTHQISSGEASIGSSLQGSSI